MQVAGGRAVITGNSGALELTVLEPAGAEFEVVSLAEECTKNQREGELKRLLVSLPAGARKFRMAVAVK